MIKPDFRKYKFYLTEPDFGTFELDYAPDGWSDEFTIQRHKTFKGILRTSSDNTLNFILDGRDYLLRWFNSKGINANITFKVERVKNDWTFEEVFNGKVMTKTLKFTHDECEAQIEDITAMSLLQSRKEMQINLNRLTTLSGATMTANEDKLILPELTFPLLATWNQPISSYVTGGEKELSLVLIGSEFLEAQTQQPGGTPPADQIFDTALITYNDMQIQGSFTANFDLGLLIGAEIRINIIPDVGLPYVLQDFPISPISGNTTYINETFTLTKNYGISITLYLPTITAAHNFSISGGLQLNGEGTTYGQIQVNAMGLYDAFERAVKITSDLDFESTFLDKTTGTLGVIVNGINIRGAFKDHTTSLQDLFNAVNSIYDVALGYEGGKIILEETSYFYTATTGLDLSDRILISDIEVEFDLNHFNSLTTGFTKWVDQYQNGLTEFNTKSIYSTNIQFDKDKKLICPYRADTIGMVKLRDSQMISNATETLDGDEDIFIVSCHQLTNISPTQNIYTARTSQNYDVYPDGWLNLDYSPSRMARRHQIVNYIGTQDLVIEQKPKIVNIVSQETGGDTIDEALSIPNSELATALYTPVLLTVNTYMTKAEIDALDWKQIIKLNDTYSGYLNKITYNYKNKNIVELQLIKV